MGLADSDKDGQISPAEWDVMQNQSSELDPWALMDTNGDGFLDRAEYEAFATEPDNLPFDSVLEPADSDDDGKMSPAEWDAMQNQPAPTPEPLSPSLAPTPSPAPPPPTPSPPFMDVTANAFGHTLVWSALLLTCVLSENV